MMYSPLQGEEWIICKEKSLQRKQCSLREERSSHLFAKEIFMHSTDNIFVKTTDRPHFRMLKRMTVIFPICLIICLSMSALASAHVRQQVSPNDTVTKVLSGTATAWSDNALLPGPSSQSVTITLTIDTAAGTCTYTFPPTQFT